MSNYPFTREFAFNQECLRAFTKLMTAKLHQAELQGHYGWYSEMLVPDEDLKAAFYESVRKGDTVDIAIYCMMLQQRGIKLKS